MSECEISSLPKLARQARVRRMMVESLARDWAMFPPPRPVRQSLDLQSLADPVLQTRPCLASESVVILSGNVSHLYLIYYHKYNNANQDFSLSFLMCWGSEGGFHLVLMINPYIINLLLFKRTLLQFFFCQTLSEKDKYLTLKLILIQTTLLPPEYFRPAELSSVKFSSSWS